MTKREDRIPFDKKTRKAIREATKTLYELRKLRPPKDLSEKTYMNKVSDYLNQISQEIDITQRQRGIHERISKIPNGLSLFSERENNFLEVLYAIAFSLRIPEEEVECNKIGINYTMRYRFIQQFLDTIVVYSKYLVFDIEAGQREKRYEGVTKEIKEKGLAGYISRHNLN